jgi:hypothetical protein
MVIGKISQQGYQPAECRFFCSHLLNIAPLPRFADQKARNRYYRRIIFSLIQEFQGFSWFVPFLY